MTSMNEGGQMEGETTPGCETSYTNTGKPRESRQTDGDREVGM